jgi:ParB-like chromosome segregation protein Spo0J
MVSMKLPREEIVKIEDLKVDGQNPNRMTERQRQQVKDSIERYGFIIPIITNKDLLIADGEQRLEVARELGMSHVKIIRLPVNDVDRRLLRQILNKVKGEHDQVADAEEFERIISGGEEESLKNLLDLSDEKLLRLLNKGEKETNVELEPIWEVVVECENEKDQEAAYEKLKGQGFKCRLSTL